MINYIFAISEEIARWTVEVYINNHSEFGWWIAFTNPTAGPWKKILVPSEEGTNKEIFRFRRESERPDLILINDISKKIIIVEAKTSCNQLLTRDQMTKSIRVINFMRNFFSSCSNESWGSRNKYKLIPAFLWFTKNRKNLLDQTTTVHNYFNKYNNNKANEDLLSIIIIESTNRMLKNVFVFNNIVHDHLNFL